MPREGKVITSSGCLYLLDETKSFVSSAKCDSSDGKRLRTEVFSDSHGFWPSLPALWEAPGQSELRVGTEVPVTVPLQTSFRGGKLHNGIQLIRSPGSCNRHTLS